MKVSIQPVTATRAAVVILAALIMGAGLALAQDDPVAESDRLLGLPKSPPPAQVIPGVASVDIAFVMLFHPKMQQFDFDSGTFEKQFPSGTTPAGRSRIVREREQARAQAAERNRGRYEELARQRFDVSQQIGQMRTELNQKIFETKNQAGKIDVGAAIARLEETFWKSRQRLEAQYLKLNDEMLKLDDQARQQVHVPAQQREENLATIESEIARAAETVAKARGYGTVLNSSFVMPDASRPPTVAPESWQLPVETFDNPYATFWNTTSEKGLSADEARAQMASLVKQWTAHRSKVLATGMSRPINRLIVSGGRDLTLEVLAFILRQQKVEEERAKLLLQTLQMLQRKG
ncbi:MAG: hypothetical protein HYY25_13525 [Candidatus Wallbacteria bacterium]|nr:hypothetical protein [Candidatus Wallbacteria bacterium]